MRITIVGCGYVGLTTAATLAYLGNPVVCLDIDREKLASLAGGAVPFLEPGLEDLLRTVSGNVTFTADYSRAASRAEAVFLAVGTPPLGDGRADLTSLRAAMAALAPHLTKACRALAVKSTVPPGTGAALRRDIGAALPLASNPEFLREGAALSDSFYPDRIVVGGSDPGALSALVQLYRPILEQDFTPPPGLPRPEGLRSVPLVRTNTESAELIKYAANAFLATKISFINEIAGLAEKVGADVDQVATAIGLDPRVGPGFLKAGLGWGGSCLGKDTAALSEAARSLGLDLLIVQAARAVNDAQRALVVRVLAGELAGLQGKTIALLGLAYKPQTDDLRDAPALDIARRLQGQGAKVKAHDPAAIERAREEYPSAGIDFRDDVLAAVKGAHATVLVTDWPCYRDLDWSEIRAAMAGDLVYDGRNYLRPSELEAAGLRSTGVGRPPLASRRGVSPRRQPEASAAREAATGLDG